MLLFISVQRHVGSNGYHNNRDMNSPSHNDSDYKYGRFDASALHIAHALKQTELQKAYNKHREKPIDYYLVSLIDSFVRFRKSGVVRADHECSMSDSRSPSLSRRFQFRFALLHANWMAGKCRFVGFECYSE